MTISGNACLEFQCRGELEWPQIKQNHYCPEKLALSLAFENTTGFDYAPDFCESREIGSSIFHLWNGPYGKPTVIAGPVDRSLELFRN